MGERERGPSDCVFHLAALADIVPSIQKPKKYYESNVTGSLNVVSSCVKNNVKKIIRFLS